MVVRINTHIHTHTPTKPCCTPYTTRHCNSSNKISVRGRNRDWSDVTHTECIYTTRIPVRHCCRRLSQWAFTTTGVFTAGPCGFSFPRLPKLSPEKFPGVLPCGWTFQKGCLSIKRMYVIVQFSHCNSKVTRLLEEIAWWMSSEYLAEDSSRWSQVPCQYVLQVTTRTTVDRV